MRINHIIPGCLLMILAACSSPKPSDQDGTDLWFANSRPYEEVLASVDTKVDNALAKEEFHIYDEAGVIGDEGSVNSAMSSFESSTGVSPAIFTIRDSLTGDDFRQYARDIYSSNFSDQDHVLIVYQLTPQNTWSWTCVFGSNTGTVFDQDTINTFQSDLTNAFSSGNVDNALVSTFNNAQSQDG